MLMVLCSKAREGFLRNTADHRDFDDLDFTSYSKAAAALFFNGCRGTAALTKGLSVCTDCRPLKTSNGEILALRKLGKLLDLLRSD